MLLSCNNDLLAAQKGEKKSSIDWRRHMLTLTNENKDIHLSSVTQSGDRKLVGSTPSKEHSVFFRIRVSPSHNG